MSGRSRPDPRRIVAMGGGGFSDRGGDPALDRYVIDVLDQDEPRICLLPTAGGDAEEQIHRFYRAFGELPCDPSHLSLFRLGTRPVDVRDLLLGQDAIYVGGGSMLNLLAIWRAHGLDPVLREAWAGGVMLCGISAGSMCWFDAGVTKGYGPPRAVRGLGFLPGSNSVHYHGEPDRRPRYLEAVRTEAIPPGYGVDDGVALHFAGTQLVEVATARPSCGAWWVEAANGGVTETPLTARLLGRPEDEPRVPLSIAEFREARLHAAERARFSTRSSRRR
jgi:peptidase E